MPYFYEAVDAAGQSVVGKLDARTESDAQQRLVAMGYSVHTLVEAPQAPAVGQPLNEPPVDGKLRRLPVEEAERAVTPPASAPAQAVGRARVITMAGNAARVALQEGRRTALKPGPAQTVQPLASTLGGVSKRDMLFFFQQLASLVHSTTIYDGLDDLAGRTRSSSLALTAREMAAHARAGGRISDVMATYPRIYPEHVVGRVRAGEMGGFVEAALADIADWYDHSIALYRGMWIPKWLALYALVTLVFAQPVFPALFPEPHVLLYLKLAFLRNLPIATGLVFLNWYIGRKLQEPGYRRLRDGLALRLPVFGNHQKQVAIATFLRYLRRLYQAGMSPPEAWQGAMDVATNVVIRERLEHAHTLMQTGAALPDAFAASGLFEDRVEQLIMTGQQTGQMVEMLERAGDYHQTQVDEAATRSKVAMVRIGVNIFLILSGASLLWITYSYFHSIFSWVDSYFGQ